jgi:hypothetical protein
MVLLCNHRVAKKKQTRNARGQTLRKFVASSFNATGILMSNLRRQSTQFCTNDKKMKRSTAARSDSS